MQRKALYFLNALAIIYALDRQAWAQSDFSLKYSFLVGAMDSLSRSALFIKTPQHYGTCTVFTVPFSDSSELGAVYVATTRHVLNMTDSTQRVIGRWDTATVYARLKSGGLEKRKYTIVLEDKKLDIAILRHVEKFRSFSEYDIFCVSTKQFATYSEIRRGQQVFLAGYPFGRGFTSTNLNPVVQAGIVAQVDTLMARVLIDIPINLGNSGCPVYVLTNSGETKLLGLVFGYEPSLEDVVIRTSTGQVVPENTSLGRVTLLRAVAVALTDRAR